MEEVLFFKYQRYIGFENRASKKKSQSLQKSSSFFKKIFGFFRRYFDGYLPLY